jgi:hypothetical protein
MMTPKTQTIVAITIIVLTTIVAFVVMPMKPDGSATVLAGMLAFIIVWNATKYLTKRKCQKSDWLNSKTRHEILFAIILASLLLLGGISTTLAKELEIFDSDLVKRILGVNIGLMLIVMGNYMPKKLTLGSGSCGCNHTKSSSTQRFVGWTLVLAGLFYAIVWLTVNLEHTSVVILFTFPAAIAVVIIARIAYLRLSKPKKIANQSV